MKCKYCKTTYKTKEEALKCYNRDLEISGGR